MTVTALDQLDLAFADRFNARDLDGLRALNTDNVVFVRAPGLTDPRLRPRAPPQNSLFTTNSTAGAMPLTIRLAPLNPTPYRVHGR